MSLSDELGDTQDFDPDNPSSSGGIEFHSDATPLPAPTRIGRYGISRILGMGGYGIVYLGHDDLLNRPVAIKVPHRKLVDALQDTAAYLAEAQTAAGLDHPHIVSVYDVGATEQFPCFIVSKFIDGTDLASRARQVPFTLQEVIELVATVAEALHYAHQKGLVHRDIKPGNLLLDKSGRPFVADFGLALCDEQFGIEKPRICGTPHYMSPEQARGESHLVDGRADIFSLGVVLYELLTGTRPFQGRTVDDVLRAVISHEPRPLRQRNEQLPREIERIVRQALAKRTSERYSTAQDFADDLWHILRRNEPSLPLESPPNHSLPETPSAQSHRDSRSGISASTSLVVVPKGLRAFDREDSPFFLGLVPGPHDREGLPPSLRFWKARIEDESSNVLRVGVVYGPSGCGKSSLIRAGLLPILDRSVRTVIVTATPQSTEAALLAELAPLLPHPPKRLVEALQRLRRGASTERRVLIVLDQFEQWLHANHAAGDTELVQALRQCDGEHVGCVLIVRDDFWMSVHRFFRELDIRLAERENCAAVDLFDMRHARRVLHAFGFAYEALPERSDELSPKQTAFLDQAIAELAEDDRVICVRLALFAQMVRNRPWIPATLTAIGGARGVGIRFLEDTFGATSAPLSYRVHNKAIRNVLRSLLPAPGTDIKACTQTASELARAAKYEVSSNNFRELLEILEDETRLLALVDAPESVDGESVEGTDKGSTNGSSNDSRAFQLTHDYLVPSIREWLTRKQKETWRGRCEIQLDERAALWGSRPERQQLPSLWETAQITFGTKSANWTASQARLMRGAQRSHGRRLLAIFCLLACAVIGGTAWHRNNQQVLRHRMADVVVDQLLMAEIGSVIPVLRELEPTRDAWTERLLSLADQPDATPAIKLRAELALTLRDRSRLGRLLGLIHVADPDTVRVVRDWLKQTAQPTPQELWDAAKSEDLTGSRLPIAVLLAEFDSASNESWPELSRSVGTSLVTDTRFETGAWTDLLMPVRERLAAEVSDQFWNPSTSSSQRFQAARLLSDLASTQTLCRLILDADLIEFSTLMRPLSRDRDAAVELLKVHLTPPLAGSLELRLGQVDQRRNTAVALMQLGRADLVWPLLGNSENGTLRTQLILTMRSFGVPLDVLLSGEESVRDPVIRQAIWQSLAASDSPVSTPDKSVLSQRVLARWPQVTDQAERAGIAWLAQRCGLTSQSLRAAAPQTPPAGSNWSINSQGQEFVKIRGPVEFLMGSPNDEPRRDGNERQHRRLIDRSFAVGVHEVTAEQFHRFQPRHAMDPNIAVTPDCPASFLSWLDGAKYCRWLSEQEGVPESQMCYPPSDQIHLEMTLPANQLSRFGYRMPTEAEWEYFCRGGTATRYFFGEDERHVSEFGWWLGNSSERTWPVGSRRPNPLGLFDVEGNVHEWCQDVFGDYPTSGERTSAIADELQSFGGSARLLRGAGYRAALRPVRVAFRYRFNGQSGFSGTGIRVVRTVAND